MSYNILEARIEWKSNQVHRITVLVDFTSSSSIPYTDVRAVFATTKPVSGYFYLPKSGCVSEYILLQVAGFGMETAEIDEIFPDWRKKLT